MIFKRSRISIPAPKTEEFHFAFAADGAIWDEELKRKMKRRPTTATASATPASLPGSGCSSDCSLVSGCFFAVSFSSCLGMQPKMMCEACQEDPEC